MRVLARSGWILALAFLSLASLARAERPTRIATIEISNQTGERLSGLEEVSEQTLAAELEKLDEFDVVDNSSLYAEIIRLRLPIEDLPSRPSLLNSLSSIREIDLLATGIATRYERAIDRELLEVTILLLDCRRGEALFSMNILVSATPGSSPGHQILVREAIERSIPALESAIRNFRPKAHAQTSASRSESEEPHGPDSSISNEPGNATGAVPTAATITVFAQYLTTPLDPGVIQLGRRRLQLKRQLPGILGENQLFFVTGKILDRQPSRLTLSGSALPVSGSSSDMGAHLPDSCLIVLDPHKEDISYSRFTGAELFYLGEGAAENDYGTRVSCSKYGDLPESLQQAVRRLEADIRQVEAKIVAATNPELQILSWHRAESRTVKERKIELAEQRSGVDNSSARNQDKIASYFSLIPQESANFNEDQVLQQQIDHLGRYLESISIGEAVQSRSQLSKELEGFRIQSDVKLDGEQRSDLERRKAKLVKECDYLKESMARSAEMYQLNMAAPRAASDYKQRATAMFEQERAGFEARFAACSAEIVEIDGELAELE